MAVPPPPDMTVQKARTATQALIEASKVVLADLRRNQQDLEHLLDDFSSLEET